MRLLWCAIYGFALGCGITRSPGQEVQTPAHISSDVMRSMLITKVTPVFPRDAANAKVNGAVVMHVIIGTDGHVETAAVVSGPEMLRASYLAAVRQWIYMPFVLNGKKVRVDTTVTLMLNVGSDQPIQPMPAGAFGNGDGLKVPLEVSGRRVRVSSGVMAGQAIKHPWPVYPPIAREEHVSGGVVLDLVIGTDGRVLQVNVISGPAVLRAGAVAAVKQWEYKPYLLNGVPTEVETTVVLQPSFGG